MSVAGEINGHGPVTVVSRETGQLLNYEAAVAAIREARTNDEVRFWEDRLAAAKEYTRRIRDRRAEIELAELKSLCKRRRGQILVQLKKAGIIRDGRRDQVEMPGDPPRQTLEDLGITKNESSEAQAIADLPDDAYTRLVERCRNHLEQHPEKHTIDVLKPPPSGPSATMHSRQEARDSLDYSPTPPWGTRALIDVVFPALGIQRSDITTCAEPACGEGHMAEVLGEYFPSVVASDIHDYGYGHAIGDFLAPDTTVYTDWIITNPPFNKAEEFALKAIKSARIGVALFVRWQWIETVGRYHSLFAPYPPAAVAVFSERIPLHMGRWEPDGDTLTAYCWVMWLNNSGPTRLLWIPPGQRDALTKPDDIERFTTHPVTMRAPEPGTIEPMPPHDPVTGEIREEGGDGLEIPDFLRRTA